MNKKLIYLFPLLFNILLANELTSYYVTNISYSNIKVNVNCEKESGFFSTSYLRKELNQKSFNIDAICKDSNKNITIDIDKLKYNSMWITELAGGIDITSTIKHKFLLNEAAYIPIKNLYITNTIDFTKIENLNLSIKDYTLNITIDEYILDQNIGNILSENNIRIKDFYNDTTIFKPHKYTNTYIIDNIRKCINGRIWIKDYGSINGNKCDYTLVD